MKWVGVKDALFTSIAVLLDLIKSYAIIAPPPIWCPLFLQGGKYGGKKVYSVHYFHSFYSSCTTVAPLEQEGKVTRHFQFPIVFNIFEIVLRK